MRITLTMIAEAMGDGCHLIRESADCAIAGVRLIGDVRPGDAARDDILYVADAAVAADAADTAVAASAAGAGKPVPVRNVLVVQNAGEGADEALLPWVDNLAATTSPDARVAAGRAADAIEALAAWDAELAEAILDRRPIDEVLAIGARMLANPIALFDEASALIAHAGELPPGYEKTIWGRVLRDGASPLDYYTRDEQAAIARELTEGGRPGIFVPSRAPEHANLAALIAVGGRVFGSIGQVDLVKPFTPCQIALASHVRDRLQQAMELSGHRKSGDGMLGSLVARLISGEQVDRSLLSFHLGRHGWSEGDLFRIAVFPLPEGTGNRIAVTTRRELLMGHVCGGIIIEHEGTMVLVERRRRRGEGAGGPDPQGAEGESGGDTLATKAFSKTIAQLDLHGASSDWFKGISNARDYHRQALVALAETEREGCAPGDVVRYADMFERHLAHLVADAVPVESVCDQRILALAREGLKGDPERGRELVRELYAYLASGRNLNRCAELLFIHRNTLSYRMDRLEELLGRDLASLSSSEVVRLELSCLLALEE